MHVVVHIGPFKTGSTSIQKSLDRAVDTLWEQGCFFYRGSKMFHEQALNARFIRHERNLTPDMRRRFSTLQNAQDWSEACWQKFEAEVQRRKPALSLISSEHFSGLRDPAPLIARLRKSFDRITIIAYVRDPVDLYCSSLQQRIRGGRRLAQLPSPLSFTYPARRQLETFTNLVGRENMIVRKFSSSNLLNGDVVTDFMATVSALGMPLSIPSLRANESMPGAAAAWVLSLNEAYSHSGTTSERQATIRRLSTSADVQALPKLKLTNPTLTDQINNNAHDACSWINDIFLDGQEPLSLGLTPAAIDPQAMQQAREQLRDWLMSYLTTESCQTVACAVMSMDNANQQLPGKGNRTSRGARPLRQ